MNDQATKRIANLKEQIKKEKSPIKKAELLLDLADYIQNHSSNLSELKDAKSYCLSALKIAKEKKNSALIGEATSILGIIYWREGSYACAQECANKTMKIAELIKDKELAARANGLLGLISEQKGELDSAINYYEQCLVLYSELGNAPLLAAHYNNLGNVFWDKGDLERALECHEKSLAIKEKMRERLLRATCGLPQAAELDPTTISRSISISLNNLGLLYEDLGDLEKAIECFYRSLVEKEKINDKVGISACYNNIGEIYLKRGRLEKAIQLFEQAVKTAEDAGSKSRKAEACGNLGNAYFLTGDYIRSMNFYIEDMNLAQEIDDKFELSEVYWRMAELLLETKDEDEAFNFLQKSIALSSEFGAKKNQGCAYRILGKYYLKQGDLPNAKQAFERGIELLEGMGKCYELGKIYFDYGLGLARLGGIRDTALRFLREAGNIFRRLEIINESEAVEKVLYQLEENKDRSVALIKSLSSLTAYGLTLPELATKTLALLQEALLFDAGAFWAFNNKPYILGNITEEELLEADSAKVRLGRIKAKLTITPTEVILPLRLAGHDLGVLYLRWQKSSPLPDSDLSGLFESISNIISLALEHIRVRSGLTLSPIRVEATAMPPQLLEVDSAKSGLRETIIGESPKMLAVFETISRVAPTKACVLILGESGTGKELVAKTIHNLSQRAQKPFITINCAAIPENLLESELFGIEKGTATGVRERIGKLEQAHEGTVFLDEIGDMSLSLQAKLLRVLQEKRFERVGGRKTIEVDIRIIAATNKDLEQAIHSGSFREDLFYRLNVINIHLPPLRERKEDIPKLTEHFIQKFSQETQRPIKGITPEAMTMLLNYSWPGNVRELQNTIERAVILAKNEYITPADLPPALDGITPQTSGDSVPTTTWKTTITKTRTALEKDFILKLLAHYNWNVTRAVKASGISRSQFYRLMSKYQIQRSKAPLDPQKDFS